MKILPLNIDGNRFRDASGRQVILRGVNLGGDSKVPFPDGGTDFPTDFSDHRKVSFVGRPFPIEDADEHLSRIQHWGFNTLRLLTTWEAVEHEGPGCYDEEYLDYFSEVCRRAGAHGLYVFVDFHQDVWSRMTGGDGAPGWTLEAVGLDFAKFSAAGAAHVMQAVYDYGKGGHQSAYPAMSWGSNSQMAANGIMWNLFFAGRILTPDFSIQGSNVQEFLQNHYLGSMNEVAKRIKTLPNVIGFDTFNEPHPTWLGQPLTYRHTERSKHNGAPPRVGPAASPLDLLVAAQGTPVTVPHMTRDPTSGRVLPTGEIVLNPDGISIWLDDHKCPFETAGAYNLTAGVASNANEDFFCQQGGQQLTVSENGYGPLFEQVADTTRRHNPDWLIFAEIDPYGIAANRPYPKKMPERSVNACHWYDVSTLYLKTFNPQGSIDPITGEQDSGLDAIRRRFVMQMSACMSPAEGFRGGAPTLLGEFGIPYDLEESEAYKKWAAGDRSNEIWWRHEIALGLMYDALDELLLNSAQWNYSASNRNDPKVGDCWNQEDFSVFSRDQQDDTTRIDSGGRAIRGFCRPFVPQTQGNLLEVRFDRDKAQLHVKLESKPEISTPTVVYLPRLWFPNGAWITLTKGSGRVSLCHDKQIAEVLAAEEGQVEFIVEPKKAS